MTDSRAATVALVVAASVMAVLVAGQVLRFVSRMLSWGLLVVFVVLLAYAAYELTRGWNEAADAEAGMTERWTDETARRESIDEEVTDAELDAEFDAQLRDPELETELDELVEREYE
ncbi:hypothetical protein [Halovivax gelatinilyticus]|uniref:hypothetical protein n=1 Tax=Halovivax gelatinilyticus TaxID=2961597 RepID=UPI0020CA5142|nr:hypothetical protein [Halovivax gelatinilyticus]